jgi:uncharacterized protein
LTQSILIRVAQLTANLRHKRAARNANASGQIMRAIAALSRSPREGAPGGLSDARRGEAQATSRQRLVPSRYNARTIGDDGRLILWNTLSGMISVIPAAHAPIAVARLRRDAVVEPLDELGESLASRGYLVPDEVDEFERFRCLYSEGQRRTDVLQLMLLVSEDCNLRCTYCYERFKRGTMIPDVRQGVRALVLARAPQLKELGHRMVRRRTTLRLGCYP